MDSFFTGTLRRITCLLPALLVLAASLAAQELPTPILGQVRTGAGAPVEYATVTLHRALDSVALKTEFTDAGGHFMMVPASTGQYLVSVAHIGYAPAWAGPFPATGSAIAPLRITLVPGATQQLRGVIVTGQKPPFERLADRTIINVEGSSLFSGSTALDVLSRSPGVTVDGSDNLALRGQRGVLVLLDGKRVPMTGTELADLLRSLPAEQVSTMELLTNPPAKYDAQGTAGVILINRNKDQRLGTNGSVNASYGRGHYGKHTSGLSLNHRGPHANFYATYAYSDRRNFQNLTFSRIYRPENQLPVTSQQRNEMRNHLVSHSWKVGLDYTLSPQTTLGAMVSGLASRSPWQGTNTSTFLDAQGQPVRQYTSDNFRNLRTPNVAANLTLRHTFRPDSAGTPELTADADMARYGILRTLDLATTFSLPANQPFTSLTGTQDGSLLIQSAKADYVRPLARGFRLEIGLKASQVRADNDVVFYRDGSRLPDTTQSNRFHYDENINAAYLTLSRTRPGLTLTAGLRAEHTVATGRQDIGNENFDRRYLQLFPNLSLSRTLSESHTVSVGLSRRLDRPTYSQLNPFRSYVDATSYRAGNPYLLPMTSYSAELTHTWRQKYTTGLSYARGHQPIVPVYLAQPGPERLVAATDVNLRTRHYYAFTLAAPLTPTKWWQLYTDVELFYIYFDGRLSNTVAPAGRPGAIATANSTFTVGKGWTADLSGSYHSRELYAFQVVKAFGQVGVGLQKSLLDGRATLRFNATDLFYTAPITATSRYQVFEETYRANQDSRVATASFSYRFGSNEVPPARKRATGAEEEKRRAVSQ
ncbi:outer membrane beta-barrel protein [Hymenobacter puniceus]|uniref:outer membrane beta-barrel protein n=1 Tax=Hymenobacter sp. BT190 TaxID=2763505 RepID=UPI0016519A8A|nr:outer membrane beta-barrel protein [Hymenobacter sp. BT190]MBC6699501.1 outer membrane beta-barrel protein [Hymenobacter sp. BT190]